MKTKSIYLAIGVSLLLIGGAFAEAKNCAKPGTVNGQVPCGESTPQPIDYKKDPKTGEIEKTNDKPSDFVGGRRR